MKHTEHTPGPWIYSPAVACVFVEQDRTHCPQICTLPAFTPENTVNGCLIAAAPDMLAALQDIEASLTFNVKCSGVAPFTEQTLHALRKVRAAIAKATGQV